jgi:nucleosome binding factor SPN SPT16 subunit
MVFCLILSFKDLLSEKGIKYTLQLADIVSVGPGKSSNSHEVLTKDIPKSINEITYNMEDEEEKNEKENKTNHQSASNAIANGYRTRRAAQQQEDEKNEQQRKHHQLELLDKKNKEFEDRFKRNQLKDEEIQITKKITSSVNSYQNKNHFPGDLRANKIYIDQKAYSLILPINGMMVPFHVSLIKNVSSSDEGGFTLLRINFHTPNSGINNLSFSVKIFFTLGQ